jgi:hypothetical protein
VIANNCLTFHLLALFSKHCCSCCTTAGEHLWPGAAEQQLHRCQDAAAAHLGTMLVSNASKHNAQACCTTYAENLWPGAAQQVQKCKHIAATCRGYSSIALHSPAPQLMLKLWPVLLSSRVNAVILLLHSKDTATYHCTVMLCCSRLKPQAWCCSAAA